MAWMYHHPELDMSLEVALVLAQTYHHQEADTALELVLVPDSHYHRMGELVSDIHHR